MFTSVKCLEKLNFLCNVPKIYNILSGIENTCYANYFTIFFISGKFVMNDQL